MIFNYQNNNFLYTETTLTIFPLIILLYSIFPFYNFINYIIISPKKETITVKRAKLFLLGIFLLIFGLIIEFSKFIIFMNFFSDLFIPLTKLLIISSGIIFYLGFLGSKKMPTQNSHLHLV